MISKSRWEYGTFRSNRTDESRKHGHCGSSARRDRKAQLQSVLQPSLLIINTCTFLLEKEWCGPYATKTAALLGRTKWVLRRKKRSLFRHPRLAKILCISVPMTGTCMRSIHQAKRS